MTKHNTADFIVIGNGIAGLSLSLKLSKLGSVIIIGKKNNSDSNTVYAQGGIASVMKDVDSFESHINDTLNAGAGLCRKDVVRDVIESGPKSIQQLMDWGVEFTRSDDGELSLAREGGHQEERIVHAKDSTGREIEFALLRAINNSEKINFYSNMMAIDFITDHNISNEHPTNSECYGVFAFNARENKVETFLGRTMILCTGGAGQVYLHSTNPSIATGDGVAMAYRAGCELENLEFMQFHPTALYETNKNDGDTTFLITEAVRGFGGILKNQNMEAFMKNYHVDAELAPRDIVARAIDAEMKKNEIDFVYLDISHKNKDEIIQKFPTIYERCKKNHIDISKDPIPVVPSAHYLCGGVKVNKDGQTKLKGLYACGEVTSTGLHGANRLASNSLLEAVVYADKIFNAIKNNNEDRAILENFSDWDDSGTINFDEWGIIAADKLLVRKIMWDYVGIVRSDFRLKRAFSRLNLIMSEIEQFYKKSKLFVELLELRNLVTTALLMVRSAMYRKESRGLHFNTDYPKLNDKPYNTVIRSSRFTENDG